MVPYVAYLRVYEPLSAFDESEAARWASYARAEAAATDTVTRLRDEQRQSLTAVLQPAGLASASAFDDSAYVLRTGEDIFVCPHDIRLRSWLALAELIDEIGDQQLRLLSPGSLEHVSPDFMSWRSKHPDAVPHIRQQTWHVPPAWLLLMDPEERETYQVDDQTSVRYRCPIVQARRRLGSAFAVIRRAFADEPVADVVSELGRWVESFHPHSWIELDYAGVARLLGDDLDGDRSCAEVAEAVQKLSRGDVADATASYERLVERWRRVRMAEHAN
ncbi:MAG TPA: hypothetical protein VHG70_04385 [Nocardioidaceae bacterium]|nr:hypothetical protein [Nocardioidaceae bacterium]